MGATKLSNVSINELSLVFSEKNGQEWAPRNGEARTLSVKAKAFGKAVIERVKAWARSPADDDGKEDAYYNAMASAIAQCGSDIQNAYWTYDDDAREAATCVAIDNLVAAIDEARGTAGKAPAADKAGKRHSAADQAHIDAVNEAHGKASSMLEKTAAQMAAMKDHLDALGNSPAPTDAEATDAPDDGSNKAAIIAFVPGELNEDGRATNFAELDALVAKAKDDEKPKGDYGDVEYADPGYQEDKKPRYPVDTKAHAESAWSYINKDSNAEKYSAGDLAKVKASIKAACEKFGITIDDSKAAPVTNVTNIVGITQAQVEAMIAAKATELQANFDAEKARIQQEADAAINTAKAEVTTTQTKLNETLTTLTKAAQAPSSGSVADMSGAIKGDATQTSGQANAGAKPLSRLGQIVKAQLSDSVTPVI